MEDNLAISVLIAAELLFLAIGLAGAILPVLPGVFIMFFGVLGAKLCMPDVFSWTAVWVGLAITFGAQLSDFLLTYLGAKRFGATWRGALGAFLGVIFGMFMPSQIFWIFVMPFFGAFLFEALGGADLKGAAKAGTGAFLGGVLAAFIKMAAVVAMFAWILVEALGAL